MAKYAEGTVRSPQRAALAAVLLSPVYGAEAAGSASLAALGGVGMAAYSIGNGIKRKTVEGIKDLSGRVKDWKDTRESKLLEPRLKRNEEDSEILRIRQELNKKEHELIASRMQFLENRKLIRRKERELKTNTSDMEKERIQKDIELLQEANANIKGDIKRDKIQYGQLNSALRMRLRELFAKDRAPQDKGDSGGHGNGPAGGELPARGETGGLGQPNSSHCGLGALQSRHEGTGTSRPLEPIFEEGLSRLNSQREQELRHSDNRQENGPEATSADLHQSSLQQSRVSETGEDENADKRPREKQAENSEQAQSRSILNSGYGEKRKIEQRT
jgi:hypothetical protein